MLCKNHNKPDLLLFRAIVVTGDLLSKHALVILQKLIARDQRTNENGVQFILCDPFTSRYTDLPFMAHSSCLYCTDLPFMVDSTNS